jgi:hypothetical protein
MTTAEQIVAKIEAALLANPLADQISLDGHSVSMPEALKKLEYWRNRVLREAGGKPVIASLNLQRV